MASIDKIYLTKQDALDFYHYLQSIDGEFKAYFKNANSIMDYVYGDENSLSAWQPMNLDDTIPVTNFPQCVDAWLLRRQDLPMPARNYMCEHQYNIDDNSSMLKEPIQFSHSIQGDVSKHFKIIKKQGCFNQSLNAYSHYTVELVDTYESDVVYVDDDDIWVPHNGYNAYLVGKDYSHTAHLQLHSFKALIRKLRSWNLPKDIQLRIEDFRYIGYLIIQGK